MKKSVKMLTSLLMALVLVVSLSAAALADGPDATITFKGKTDQFVFGPGSEYSETDLFARFKNVMPGDLITQQVLLRNEATDCDYVKIYLKAVPHEAEVNDPVMEQPENLKPYLSVAEMNELLAHVQVSVLIDDEWTDCTGDPARGMLEPVQIAKLRHGRELPLTIRLAVDPALGNEYANRAAEVDWVFLAEGLNDPVDDRVEIKVNKVWDDYGKNRPTQAKIGLYDGDRLVETAVLNAENGWKWTFSRLDPDRDWNVREIDVPFGYEARYQVHGADMTITNVLTQWGKLIQTGQTKWPIPVLGGLGAVLLIVGAAAIRKNKKDAHE